MMEGEGEENRDKQDETREKERNPTERRTEMQAAPQRQRGREAVTEGRSRDSNKTTQTDRRAREI